MTTWEFSDGTIARLGGDVEGASLFAQELRAKLADPDVRFPLHPGPGGSIDLDREDATLFDAFLRDEMQRPYRRDRKLRMTLRPEHVIGELPADTRDQSAAGGDAIF